MKRSSKMWLQGKIYTRGAVIFPHSSSLVDTVVVGQNNGCANPIETQYYTVTVLHLFLFHLFATIVVLVKNVLLKMTIFMS